MELTAYLLSVVGKVVFWLITVKYKCPISYCLHTVHRLANLHQINFLSLLSIQLNDILQPTL